ncbi:MAG: AAA family ATPase [Bacteroidia bacterium]|nr:AAA family ATPase [Bacteroidia bacterium]
MSQVFLEITAEEFLTLINRAFSIAVPGRNPGSIFTQEEVKLLANGIFNRTGFETLGHLENNLLHGKSLERVGNIKVEKYLIDGLIKYLDINGSFPVVIQSFRIIDPINFTIEDSHPTAKIDKITIHSLFSISLIEILDLGLKKEIYFLGENGDGKTLFLQGIALALKGSKKVGRIVDFIKESENEVQASVMLTNGLVFSFSMENGKHDETLKDFFAYGVHRNRIGNTQEDSLGYLTLFDQNSVLNDPILWLKDLYTRDLEKFRDKGNGKESLNLEVAKEILVNVLDENVTIEVSSEGVFFLERGTSVKFNQLSDGYRSVVSWVCDLLSRLATNQPQVKSIQEFEGIVLVDEIGLYLHPKWQYQIVRKLRDWFPKIQWFFTTHSPTVVLGASDDAVFYRLYKEDGVTKISEPLKDISEYTANSILTSPLFGLPSAMAKAADEEDLQKFSSDDYVYKKIHDQIAEEIRTNPGMVDEDVMKKVRAQLAELRKGK